MKFYFTLLFVLCFPLLLFAQNKPATAPKTPAKTENLKLEKLNNNVQELQKQFSSDKIDNNAVIKCLEAEINGLEKQLASNKIDNITTVKSLEAEIGRLKKQNEALSSETNKISAKLDNTLDGKIFELKTREEIVNHRGKYIDWGLMIITIVVAVFGIGISGLMYYRIDKQNDRADKQNEKAEKLLENIKQQSEELNVLIKNKDAEFDKLINQKKAEFDTFKNDIENHIRKSIKEQNKLMEQQKKLMTKVGDLTNRGQQAINAKDYSEAVKIYSELIDIDPENHIVYLNRGNAYFNQEKFSEAIKDYSQAIVLKSDYVYAYVNRGLAYAEQEKFSEAIKDYNKLLDFDPKNNIAYFNRGNAYIDQEKFSEAINDYNKAIELKPDDAEAYFNRGLAYTKQKKFFEAINDYKTALKYKPDGVDIKLSLIELLIITNHLDEADKYCKDMKTHNLSTQDVPILSMLKAILALTKGQDTKIESEEFNKTLKGEISLTWNLEYMEQWLESSEFNLGDEIKTQIQEIIAKYKARQDELRAEAAKG